jgi:hypothetical protein
VSEDTVPYGSARSRAAADKTVITPAEAAELRQLYDDLEEASTAAAEALSTRGLAGLALTRFRELNARVVAIVDRIDAILG